MDKHVGVSNEPSREAVEQRREPLANTEKPFWQRIWPIIGCGAGLFSDGYLNGVIGSVSTILATVYPDQYKNSAAQSNVSSITFVAHSSAASSSAGHPTTGVGNGASWLAPSSSYSSLSSAQGAMGPTAASKVSLRHSRPIDSS